VLTALAFHLVLPGSKSKKINVAAVAVLYTLTDQLAEIRKFKYSKLLCDNTDHISHIQPDVFFHPLSVVNSIAKSVQLQYVRENSKPVYSFL